MGGIGVWAWGVDRYEKTAYLEWWANPSACLARIPIRATAITGTGAWEAVFSPSPDHGDLENLRRLIDADPCFTLRFEASAVEVQTGFDGIDRLRLTVLPAS